MAYTEKYCVTCRRKLSRQEQSSEAAFLNACRSMEGNPARYKEVIIEEIIEEDGICFECRERTYVTYYEL